MANFRLQRYKRNRIAGMNQYNAARAAGYSESMCLSKTNRMERSLKVGISDYLEQAGLTDKYIADRLFELCGDKKSALPSLALVSTIKGHVKIKTEHTERKVILIRDQRAVDEENASSRIPA